ncbi:hypothetical protein L873DRAFT_1797655 [Choiromyces venosus 120613-1]|uniref:Uncharacterized protein n=1 Tax=Choiromyces venosus 120613-1 TaxID=1336337 RepID=A0A3N4K5P7_9PEZI|nr:hypothetical protein L873DRAFT_1797655 [Choiromyces venosus 120613-1]
MVSFLKTFLLFIFAARTAYSLPGFSDSLEERESHLQKRDIDWGNYVYIASIFSGIVGQNLGLIALPGNRAICPTELWNLQSCSESFVSECLEERFAFQWCLGYRITVATCGPQWLNMTLGCMGESSAYCVETLVTLYNCAILVTVPPVPPP